MTNARILLIEDNEMNRQVVRDMFAVAGLSIDEAVSGSEGLRMVERELYDLLLVDLHMPEVDGFEVIEAVRSRNDDKATVPIIVASGEVSLDLRMRCLTLGANDVIMKPIAMQSLFESIEVVFASGTHRKSILG
jgi:two-component system response regulator QseB